jgi:hypothetical protein
MHVGHHNSDIECDSEFAEFAARGRRVVMSPAAPGS